AVLLWLPGASFAQHGGGHHAGGFSHGRPPMHHFAPGQFHHGGLRPDLDRRFLGPRRFDRDFDRGLFRFGVAPRFVAPRFGPRFVDPRFGPAFVSPFGGF